MTDVEVELLPHGHDRRIVDVAFTLQFRFQFCLRSLVRLRRDRSEQTELVFGKQLNCPVGQGVALGAPAIPADVGMNVLGIKADSLQDTHRLGKNLVADAVARHRDHRVFSHESRFSL